MPQLGSRSSWKGQRMLNLAGSADLAARGLSRAIVETFGLGVCPETSRSIMKARLCIPIHNPQGELVAYAGRWLGDEVPEGELRYKLPEGFRKSLVLYNLHRVAGAHHLVVVEGLLRPLPAPRARGAGRSPHRA